MDKRLKKLSRLELLELMVQISEEKDALVAENNELRHALSKKPTIPRAAKVGSIAELAMQTNGFFEAAQHAADDYLREIKRMRDQLANRVTEEGMTPATVQTPSPEVQQISEALVKDAQAQARAILKRANSQAEAIMADARAKSEATIADANRQSRAIVSRANRQADAVISAAHNNAGRARTTTKTATAQAQPSAAADAGRARSSVVKSTAANRQPVAKNPGLSAPIHGRHVRAAAEGA